MKEKELISILKASKNVLLIEPPYIRKYIPLGLAKISSFIKLHNGKVTYSREIISGNFDLICIATMFTNDSKIVLETIKKCKSDWFLKDVKIIVGGIFASVMPEYIYDNTGVSIFTGCSKILDSYLPDYDLDYKINGFFNDTMTLFTTRGCINKCGYCMVWRMEPEYYICPAWKKNIENINREVCVVSDNSFLSASYGHIENVVNSLNKNNKKVIFNNGMNCREINDKNAKLLASLTYIKQGFRIGFDRINDDGHYQTAMQKLINAGLKIAGNSYTYILYNFKEIPQNAYYRTQESWRFKSNPYLMRYRPLNQVHKKLDYIGKYWTMNLIRAFNSYGQNFGYNRGDKTFEGWMKSSNIILTDEDWDKWYYRKEDYAK